MHMDAHASITLLHVAVLNSFVTTAGTEPLTGTTVGVTSC